MRKDKIHHDNIYRRAASMISCNYHFQPVTYVSHRYE